MATRFNIPEDYTVCGEYRGCCIALRHGRYSVFEQSSLRPDQGARWPETYSNRAEVEKSIDFAIEHNHLPAA